jgi:hypothetical protein
LVVIRHNFKTFVYCDPQADLSPVPDDLTDVINWAIEISIRWIKPDFDGEIHALSKD